MKKFKFLILVILLIAASCIDREKRLQSEESVYRPDSTAIKLNNKAVKLIGRALPYNDSLNTILYDSAITYLDQAIEKDRMYLMAYTNKSQVLRRKGLFEQSLEVLNEAQVINPYFAEVIMGQGFLLEKMGNMELANKKYKEALQGFEKRLKDNPESIKVQSDIAFLYVFLEDQNKAIDEIQNLILEHPDSQELKAMEGYIKGFDRKKFIEEY